jgi:2,3-diketo-5-methylthio-1-phosphopentane phosphatase
MLAVKSELPFRVKIFSDFDGTISNKDSLKHLLSTYGGPHWKRLERGILEGRVAEADALPKMFEDFPLLPDQAQAEVLDAVRLDPSFRDFARWCETMNFDLTILSGGFESFIRPLLVREGLSHLDVIANDVNDDWSIRRARVKSLCSLCTHCKSSSLLRETQKPSQTLMVYIGDGHTDFCPVQLAHLVFAKSALKDHCLAYGRQFLDFNSFEDVLDRLQHALTFIQDGLCDSNSVEAFLGECERRFGYQTSALLAQVA